MAEEIGPDEPTRSAGVVETETQSLRAWGLDGSEHDAAEHDDAANDEAGHDDAEHNEAAAQRITPRTIVAGAIAASLVVAALAAVIAYRSLNDPGPAASPASSSAIDSPMRSVSVFDGTYRIFHDWPNTTFHDGDSGTDGAVQWKFDEVDADYWYAFSSTCTKTDCVATGTPLDAQRNPLENVSPVVLRLVDGVWDDIATSRWQEECTDPASGAVIGRAWNSQRMSFRPQPDGTFVGTLTTRVDSNECGDEGTTASTPLVATRVAGN
jgi:hypothetical protein